MKLELTQLLKIYDTRLDKLARRVNDLEKLARLQGEQLGKMYQELFKKPPGEWPRVWAFSFWE